MKEYLRKLVRPKQIIERRQKLMLRERNERQEVRLKQSSIEFANARLGRMLGNQGNIARIFMDRR